MSTEKIYLIGICGTGMAALAAMLKSRGHTVSGSDANSYPPMSTFLQEQGIPVFEGYDPANLQSFQPDRVIIGNSLSRGNAEVEFVLNRRLEYLSMPEALSQFFIRGKYSCVVSGTHGKTTTSSLLTWILEVANYRPNFFIGGIPENFGRGYQLASGEHFIVEGDEYDSAFFDKGAKFLHYRPDLLIINNIEYDHADIYANLQEIQTAFQRLVAIVPGNGYIIANGDDENARRVLEKSFSNVHLFGFGENLPWRAVDLQMTASGNAFSLLHENRVVCRLTTPLVGSHNVLNTTAAFIAATLLGVPQARIVEAIQTFRGVRRRMTLVGEIGGVLVFDDFAHHATAVRETLRGMRQRYPGRRLWAIFEPRTASAKRKVFEHSYYHAFDDADQVLFAPLHRPDKVPAAERISLENIVAQLRTKQIPARATQKTEDILSILRQEVKTDDILVFMSNGDFDGLPGRVVRALADHI